MKFTCDKSVLLSGINKVKKTADIRSSIPALQGILIEADAEKVKFSATDLEFAIQYESTQAKIEEPGKVLVPARILGNIVRMLSGELRLNVEGDKLLISFGESIIRLNTLPEDEFPAIPKLKGENTLELDCNMLRNALKKTMFAMSPFFDRAPVFNGMLFKANDGKIDFVASDMHRLAAFSGEIKSNSDFEIVVPRNAIKELFRLIGKDESTIQLTYSESEIQFTFGDITILAQVIKNKFLNYKNIIPKNPLAHIGVNKAEITTAIKRACVFTNSNARIVSIKGKEKLNISASSDLFGSLDEKITVDHEGEEIRVFLNIEFMLQGLSIMSGDYVEIYYHGPYQAITMAEDNFIQLILPLRCG